METGGGELGKIGTGTKWKQVKNWDQVGPGGNRWGKLGKIGTKWDQVERSGENREKLGLSGTKSKQVGKTGKNWD